MGYAILVISSTKIMAQVAVVVALLYSNIQIESFRTLNQTQILISEVNCVLDEVMSI